MKKIYPLLLILALGIQSFAQHSNTSYLYDPGADMHDHNLRFISMRLAVDFVPEKGLVKGDITHYFTPIRETVDSFFLDGPGIIVKAATLNGKPVKYHTTDDGIYFYPSVSLSVGETDSMNIVYDAYPQKGLYFIGWNDPNNLSRKQIWTQGEGTDNRYWFPCDDWANDKLITEVTVKFQKGYQVLSNGLKVEERELSDGNVLWHYKMSKPHASYLVMLGIGKYAINETRSASGIPLYQWYYPEWKDRFPYTYKYNEKVFNFLESEIGVPYAWESYSQIPVQDFMFGAMENTTATLFGDFFEVDNRSYNDRNYVSVNAHELAHQWFGDLVTGRAPNCMWLQESFATHYNLLAERECFGQDYFDWSRRQAYLSAINTADKKPVAHSQVPTSILYQKGSVVLEMLKTITGHEGFQRAVKRYLLAHKYGNADGNELLDAFRDELGMPLQWFWDEWIYRGGEPDYKVSYADITEKSVTDKEEETGKRGHTERYTQFVVSQIQPTNEVMGLFKMPIEFEVYYTDGTVDKKTEWIEKQIQIVKVPNKRNADISFVLFDPNSEVLKTVTFDKPFQMLKAQALHAPHMLDRYDAIYAMRSIATERKRNLLKKVFETNAFHAIRTEAITQLLDDKTSEDLVRMALHDKDVQVRKGVVINTKIIPASLRADYEALLLDSSYATIQADLEKLCNSFPEHTQKYLDATRGIEGNPGRNVLVKWLEISIQHNPDTAQISELVNLVSQSYEFLTRNNAMTALRRLNYFDEKVLDNCLNACLSPNGRLSGTASETIRYFYAQDKYKRMIATGINKAVVNDKNRKLLNKLIE